MAERFEERDLSGAVFHEVNLGQARFEDVNLAGAAFGNVNLAGATVRNANLGGLSIEDAYIGGLTVSGFRVDELIEAELDRRDPERIRLRMADPYDPACVRAVLLRLSEVRARFVAFLRATDPGLLVARPASEDWSALECLRHLVFAQDLYLNRWLLRNAQPWCPLGLLPAFLAHRADFAAVGSQPTDDLDAVLAAWEALHARTWQYVANLSPEELRRDTREIDFGQGDAAHVLQGLAPHDLVHIRQAEAAVAHARGAKGEDPTPEREA
jgi:hypothetical protein